jgi:arylsulfatase A-like enzyme
MKYLLTLFAGVLLAGSARFCAAVAGPAARPNIVVILADDLGYGDLGCYNPAAKVPTPNLDRLARQGRRYTDAHSPSTVCTPSRYSLMTGRMCFRTGYRGGVFSGVGGPSLIEQGRMTLPGMLRVQGYATACVGKWHIGLTFQTKDGTPVSAATVEGANPSAKDLARVQLVDFTKPITDGPVHRGFDYFFGTACCPTTDWLYAYIENDRVPVPPTGRIDAAKLPKHAYSTDLRRGWLAPDFDHELVDLKFLEKSKAWLEQQVRRAPKQPFFLFHAMQAVHLPSFAAPAFKGKTQAGPHGDFIAELDHIVGELVATLEKLGVADNTLILFSSDNGPETLAAIHMRADFDHDPARPWRGVKRDNWEGGHRVPLIAYWPGRAKPGVSHQTVSLTDVMATCAAIIGAKLPANAAEDSFSFLSDLVGVPDGTPQRDYTLQQSGSLSLGIRRGEWKYLDHRGSGGNNYNGEMKRFALPETAPEAPGQLYNLATDPGETTNLYFKHPEIVRELKALLDASKAMGRTAAARNASNAAPGGVTPHGRGLHGYIGYSHDRPPAGSGFSAGMGFYAAVWPLIDRPLANFQIGLPGSWVTPDNSDNKDQPLAPEGTLARTWKARGPTWSSVFQTLEGGLGYWARNHFRYGPPKFSLNATPQCYDYEIGSPGWSFFYSDEALPDHRLGVAQLSNRLLIPPDALPFEGNPNGEFLGYTWMALPFTDPTTGDPPTGDQSWTCFLSAANFKGPMAYYIPETWSKIGKLFNTPFLHGRGLDARPGHMGGGAMEINTVPRFDAKDSSGITYSKLPKLQFPVDEQGRAFLVQDVIYYSKDALYHAFKAWRDGGPACSGQFDPKGTWKPTLTTRTTRYDQAGNKIVGVERVFDTKIFEGNVWGLQWFNDDAGAKGVFPQYYKHVGEERVAVAVKDVPPETGLLQQEFKVAGPTVGAWSQPGPKLGPFTVKLTDGSLVTYSWYRFVDQPSFQQYAWSAEKKAKLQAFVEKLHAQWPIDRDYMAPPSRGTLVKLDPALLVTPPKGLEIGYVPIVTRQAAQ